jgi:hypothetical protein
VVVDEGDAMNEQIFDTFTRRATQAVSRRSSLAALSGAALAAGLLATPITTAAKGNKGNKGKKAKQEANKRCTQQEGQCHDAVQVFCAPVAPASTESVTAEGTPEFCRQQFSPCCEFFANCDARTGVACLLERFEEFVFPKEL